MVILLATTRTDTAALWREMITRYVPDASLRVWPDVGDAKQIDVALAWKAPAHLLASLPNLKLIYSLGMGVDHLIDDPSCPLHVPIVRLVDPDMTAQMSEYAAYAALYFHRRFDLYARLQNEGRWEELPFVPTAQRLIGIMGLGEVGRDCARKLRALGFPVAGWSRTPKSLSGVACHHGPGGLETFLARPSILICALPSTAATAGIVNRTTLAGLARGSFLINIARGSLVVEPDLLDALDCGHLEGAMLDVTQVEPLPASSRLWSHPKVRLTPHVAGLTNPRTAILPIAENLQRFQRAETLLHVVDRKLGY